MSFNAGEMVGPYRITEQLGQGGMATVYKAYHAALDRYVALKVLHPAFLEDANFLARFQREARLVAKLDHPNIVPIYDYAEHEGRPYLVMKFIEGETLKARLSREPIGPEETSHVVEAVGAALAYAHKRGILHRDIKPSNVLLSTEGQIYLADFGLARIAQSSESTLTSDMILGTPQYISPEQALGKKDLDEGTDIYSFGVMIYELVVGKVPFSADTPFSVIHDHIYSPLPMPRHVNPDVSDDMERVLLKALSKERRDRYKDVHALVDAFQHAWQENSLAGGDETAAQRTKASATVASAPSPTVPAASLQTVVAAPAAAADVPASVSGVAGTGESVEGSGMQAQAKKPKKKLSWMWLAVGVIFICACLFTFTTLRSIRRQTITTAKSPTPASETLGPLQTPQTLTDIARAEQNAAQNPKDPNAYLQLTLAYWAANLPEQAQEAVTNIEKTAVGNEDFFRQAGKTLAVKDAWLAAARLFLDAAELHIQTGKPLPDDLSNQLHEAAYKAFKEQNAPDYISFERLSAVDEPLQIVAKSRYTFYYGDRVQAQTMLNQLMSNKPDMPEGQLLQAEFSAKVGDTNKARVALADLRSNPRAVQWMLDEANLIEGNLP